MTQELVPPLKIQVKLTIKADRMILFLKTTRKVNHATQKGPARPDYFRCMMQVANK